MPKILVIQHSPVEGLGTLAEELPKYQLEPHTLMATDHNTVFPSGAQLEQYAALIILGGPYAAYEADQHHWMQKEMMVIQEALRQKKPILGICLGAQLLAVASGGRAYRGPKAEIGWGTIRLDDWYYKRNPVFFQLDHLKEHPVFQWHGDTFDIPSDGYRLALNDQYVNQAFSFQGNTVGLQFHIEVDEEMINNWLKDEHMVFELSEAGQKIQPILEATKEHLPALRDMARKMFTGFAAMIRENVRRAA